MDDMSVEDQATLIRTADAAETALADLIDAMFLLTNAQDESITGIDSLINAWVQTGLDNDKLANLMDRYMAPQAENLERATNQYELCWRAYYRTANSYLYTAEQVATPQIREKIAEDFRDLQYLFVDEEQEPAEEIEESHSNWPTPAFDANAKAQRHYREVIERISDEASRLIARAEALVSQT